MTNHQYLERMLELTTKLTNAADEHGLKSEPYNEVLKEIALYAVKFNRGRRRQAWFHLASIVVLACVLAYGFYIVLQLLKM